MIARTLTIEGPDSDADLLERVLGTWLALAADDLADEASGVCSLSLVDHQQGRRIKHVTVLPGADPAVVEHPVRTVD